MNRLVINDHGLLYDPVIFNMTVKQSNVPVRMMRDAFFMGHQDSRVDTLVDIVKQLNDIL